MLCFEETHWVTSTFKKKEKAKVQSYMWLHAKKKKKKDTQNSFSHTHTYGIHDKNDAYYCLCFEMEMKI